MEEAAWCYQAASRFVMSHPQEKLFYPLEALKKEKQVHVVTTLLIHHRPIHMQPGMHLTWLIGMLLGSVLG
jgi:hypothetical protein